MDPTVATLLDIAKKLKEKTLALEERIKRLEEAAPGRKRTPTLYPIWEKIQTFVATGNNDAGIIAKELGIPYTTARAYMAWDEDQVAKKKAEWENYAPSKQVALLQKVGF